MTAAQTEHEMTLAALARCPVERPRPERSIRHLEQTVRVLSCRLEELEAKLAAVQAAAGFSLDY